MKNFINAIIHVLYTEYAVPCTYGMWSGRSVTFIFVYL